MRGKILVCLAGEISKEAKGKTAATVGAVGMIVCNSETYGNNISVHYHVLPTAELNYIDGLTVFSYINSTKSLSLC